MKMITKILFHLTILAILLERVKSSQSSISYKYNELFLETDLAVDHMELDISNHGCKNILVSSWPHLMSTDGDERKTLMSNILSTGFTQVDRTRVALIDYDHSCLKMVDRDLETIETLAGTCGSKGYVEGGVGVGKLNHPFEVISDARNHGKVLISDQNNHALRSLDLSTGELSTVLNGSFNFPRNMLWAGDRLIVTNYGNYISLVEWLEDNTVTNTIIISSTTPSDVMGAFELAAFAYPFGLAKVRENLYLVADAGNKKLKVLDLKKRVVGPVCFKGEDPCITSSELPDAPMSLLNVDDEIYIGMEKNIYKLFGSSLECPYTNITAFLEPGKDTVQVDLIGGHSIRYGEGVHRVDEEYDLRMCPYYVIVYSADSPCPFRNLTAYVPSADHRTQVLLPDKTRRELSVGIHQMSIEDNFRTCTYYVHVKIGSPIGKRLIFYTKHRFSCDFMEHDNATKIFMSAILLHRQYQFQQICGDDCSMSTEYEPKYRCANNQTLTSYWTTDQIYPEETSRDLEDTFRDLVNEIRHRLHQEEYMQNVDIYSYLLQYPVIQGEINSYGDLVTVELAALCADGTPTYNATLTCAD